MTVQLLAPVIPSSRVPASRQRARPAAARRLPLTSPVPVPPAPGDVVYGIARIDSSGRICERAIITALGWAGGDLLTFTADAGVVTARREPRARPVILVPCGQILGIMRRMSKKTPWVFVDCEARGASPVHGVLTEFGAVHYDTRDTFHGPVRRGTGPCQPGGQHRRRARSH
ncbi:MAG: hypothetical protein ACRDOI_40145 [Trebonia sp.]